MTVKELIKKLRQVPEDWEVCISNNANSIQAHAPRESEGKNRAFVQCNETPVRFIRVKPLQPQYSLEYDTDEDGV